MQRDVETSIKNLLISTSAPLTTLTKVRHFMMENDFPLFCVHIEGFMSPVSKNHHFRKRWGERNKIFIKKETPLTGRKKGKLSRQS